MTYFVFLLLAVAVTKGWAATQCESMEVPATSAARSRLRQDLLCQYDNQRVPMNSMNISLEIFVRRARVVHGTFDADILASMRWHDRFLAWDPATYEGVQEIRMRSQDIWTPHIIYFNTLPWFREEGRPQADFWPALCRVSSNGSVTCTSSMEVGGICSLAYLYWPHVEAECNCFIAADFHMHRNIAIAFDNKSSQAELSFYVPGNDWIITTLTKTAVHMGDDLYALVYKIKLHTRGANITAALIGPAVVLSLMLLGSFILPITSFIRLGMCCCSTFGSVLASSLLLEYIEPYGGPNPLVVVFYTGLHILSAIATSMVLLLSIVVPKSTKPEAPRWLYSFQTWLFHSKTGKLWLKAMVLAPSEQSGEAPGAVNGRSEDSGDPSNGEATANIQMTDTQLSTGPHKIWEFTACFFNRCLCIIFLIIVGILGLYLAYAVTIYNDPQTQE